MCAHALSLPADEIAVGGRCAALAGRPHVAVGAETHRATGVAPLEARVLEDAVEARSLRLRLDQAGARNHPGLDPGCNLATADHLDSATQVLDAAVGARADEHAIDADIGHQGAGREVHI